MAGPWYVSSVNGSDASDGLSKANAKATVDGASGLLTTAIAAGEIVRIDKAHDETWAATHTLLWPGTKLNPNIIISIDWTPDTFSKATVRQLYTTVAASHLEWDGETRLYGMYLEASGRLEFRDLAGHLELEDCTLKAGNQVMLGSASAHEVRWVDTELISTTTSLAAIQPGVPGDPVHFIWSNGPNNSSKFTGGSETEFLLPGSGMNVRIVGVDLSTVNTKLVDLTSRVAVVLIEFVNCTIPASVTVADWAGDDASGRVHLLNCDDTTGNDLHRTEGHDRFGVTVVTDADFNDDGASDGTTNIAWKMVSGSRALEFHGWHESLWISGWVNSPGPKVFTIETNSENVTFQDDELWMELEFLDSAGDTQSGMIHDRMVNVDSTPANQHDSAANPTWTTPNITTEKKQQLQVQANVLRPGPFRARVCLAKPSATVWIDPLVKVT